MIKQIKKIQQKEEFYIKQIYNKLILNLYLIN